MTGLRVKVSQRHSRLCKAKDGSKLHLESTTSMWLTEDGRRPRGNKLGPCLWFVVACHGGSGQLGRCCRFFALVRRDSIEAGVREAVLAGAAGRGS
jgi:hypothetical protein